MPSALMSRGLHKYPPIPATTTQLIYGTRVAKLLGSGDPPEDPTTDTTPEIVGYLPPGWILNIGTVELFDGTTVHGTFDITSGGTTISIVIISPLPYGTYSVVGTPVTDTNGIDRPIVGTITIIDPLAMLGAFHTVFNNAFKEVWKA